MMLKAAAIFSDHMVLQRGQPVPVWGSGRPGATVTCRMTPGNEIVQCQADSAGHWQLQLPALPAGGPYILHLTSGEEEISFADVWWGEVWLAGGQSNMELPLSGSRNGEEVLAHCEDVRLHFYETPKVTTVKAAAAAVSGWKKVTPCTAANLSAVAYYAARALAETLDVHIGILECFWGGTYAHCWMPRSLLKTFPEGQARIRWYDKRMGNKTDAQFEAECAAYQVQVDEWNRRIAARRAAEPDVSWAVLNTDCGLYPWPPPAGRTGFQRPGNLFESMLQRICPYGLRGVWYYQGEQDEEWPQDYQAELTRLVRCWRSCWQNNTLPFLLVQLPMYATSAGEDSWPVLRQAQAEVASTEPNMGLVVLADCGEADNIHPTDKAVVGQRLALLALETVYGKQVTGVSPRLLEAERGTEPGQVLLRFVQCGGAMQVRGGGVQLAGADGVFFDAQCQAVAPDCIRAQCAAVQAPCAVRYAWYNFGPAGLYGGTGLPAVPFGTYKLKS